MLTAAAASPATPYGAWAYLAIFALMTVGWAGVPGIGGAVVGWAAVLASQGKLDIVAVLVVAALGTEAGGLLGYRVGDRCGRKFLARRGRWHDRLQEAASKGEAVYAKWGRIAVFFTPTTISGLLRMKYSQFVVWNFVAGLVYVLSIGPAAYGMGKISAGHADVTSSAALAAGVFVAAGCLWLGVRHYRRHKAGARDTRLG